jgi:hypothetical protein
MPSRYNLDLKFEKSFILDKLTYAFVVDVHNVTNRRNVDNVFSDTGLPDDPNISDGLGNGMNYYSNPTHWTSPRSVHVALQLKF